MTLEFSLRRRARLARYLAAGWLILATLILVGTYLSLPPAANHTANAFRNSAAEQTVMPLVGAQSHSEAGGQHIEFYVIGTLTLCVLTISFACFLLGRAAFVEIELSARFSALADALCVAGDDFDRLEKSANLMLPGTKYLSVPEIFSTQDLDSLVEVIKAVKPQIKA
jgi:hypothetical protein